MVNGLQIFEKWDGKSASDSRILKKIATNDL